MRRKDKEITGRKEVLEVLNKCGVLRLGMCKDDIPYIVPLCFATEENDGVVSVYIHSASEGKKTEFISANSRVCFEADTDFAVIAGDEACRYTAAYRSVIGSGTAEIICDDQLKRHALDLIMQKYAGHGGFEYKESALSRVSVIIITVSEMTGKRSG